MGKTENINGHRVFDSWNCNRPNLDTPEVRRKKFAEESSRFLRIGAKRGDYPLDDALRAKLARFDNISGRIPEGKEIVLLEKKVTETLG